MLYLIAGNKDVEYLVDGLDVQYIPRTTQLVRNTGFEATVDDEWQCLGGCKIERTQEEAYEGSWSLKITKR